MAARDAGGGLAPSDLEVVELFEELLSADEIFQKMINANPYMKPAVKRSLQKKFARFAIGEMWENIS
jgi:hypothetical protein